MIVNKFLHIIKNIIIIISSIIINSNKIYSQDSIIHYFSTFCEQLNNFSNVSKFSGTQYTDYHTGIKKAYLFNGDFIYPISIKSNYFYKKNNLFLIQFFPDLRLRIFSNDLTYNDKSKPVRTPSYNPKICFNFSNLKLWKNNFKSFYYIQFNILHHSNGQDGWEFNFPDGTINLYNGNFSESLYFQYLIGKYTKTLKNNNLYIKTGYEWHPKYFSNMKLYQSNLYGGNRIISNLQFSISKSKNKHIFERHRISLDCEFISDLTYYSGNLYYKKKIEILDFSKRLNINITYNYILLNTKALATFVQLAYFGSDNYNIYFQQSMFSARIGISLGKFY